MDRNLSEWIEYLEQLSVEIAPVPDPVDLRNLADYLKDFE